ncbi:hypothetical protein QDR37_04575 [Amnibacterium sp. CER49]|uniref:family 4 glycosyl hydrolase n=1 Tax=Amnibacterium sp. CER49 TaxID=3039161 RepID=UPI00244A4D4C|nr:hypothetical protein [Amnibacterium sp. CER49]MDH2443218.1 hypothetical protein [Amnibacterium sp. CER49]
MSGRSFVLIGAGSTVFTPGLLRDLASNPAFNDFTIRLVDLNEDAAETMAELGRRIARDLGSDMKVEAFTERRDALPGARFVTTTIAVGSAAGWLRDLEIPAAYGVQQTVGDSVGPGGLLRALRHVPELVRIAEDVADLAPGAWMVNYTNPLTANVRGVVRETGVSVIGLCHGTMHSKAVIAAELGLQDRDVHAVFAGVNHLCWLLELSSGGVDLYPRFRELVEARAQDRAAPSNFGEGAHSPVSADLLRGYGLYPAPGDRHVSEFFAEYLRGAEPTSLPWGLQGGQDMTFQYIGEKDELWNRLHAEANGSEPLTDSRNQEAERLVSIAAAILTGRDHVELAVNLPNDGKIPNLPPEAVVEVPAVVGAAGVTGLAVGELPPGIATLLTARAQQQELVVQAAVTGSRALAVQALMLDPLVPDGATARAILDDAVAADPSTMARFARDA